MPKFVVTGSYTGGAFKGMIEKPSDREAAARGIVEAAGGQLESFHLITGPSDFMIIVTIDDVTSLLAGLMVSAGAGAITNVQTMRAFTAEEFMQMQRKAASIQSSYQSPS